VLFTLLPAPDHQHHGGTVAVRPRLRVDGRQAHHHTGPQAAAHDEFTALLAATTTARDACLVAFLGGCALRVGQLVSLLCEDIHLVPAGRAVPGCAYTLGPHLHLVRRDGHPKGAANKSRGTTVVPVPEPVQMIYAGWLRERTHIRDAASSPWAFVTFPGPTGNPGGEALSTRRVQDLIADLSAAAGLRHLHPHMLRHTFGATAADLDVARDVLQRLLGHADVGSQDVYRRASDARVAAAALAVGDRLFGHPVTAVAQPAGAGFPVLPQPDWDYLAAHGVDRTRLELRFPLGADWHTLRSCAHPSCARPAASSPWLCHRCVAAWRADGAPAGVAGWCLTHPAPPARRVYGETRCAVGCERPAEAGGLCKSCASARAAAGLDVAAYLTTSPTARPGFGPCAVRVCHRMAAQHDTRLCKAHQRQWAAAGRPALAAWSATAAAVYTTIDLVPLTDLPSLLAAQVLVGYEAQLRGGGRLSPVQVKSAVRWLVEHAVTELLAADLPARGQTTAYLRQWRAAVDVHAADRSAEHTRTVVRLQVLDPRFRGGRVDLRDIHAPWLLHLTQQHLLHLAATGASTGRLAAAGYAARWFAAYLREHHPDAGRRLASLGRADVVGYLAWLTDRARDSTGLQLLGGGDPRRAVIAERLLSTARRPTTAGHPDPAPAAGADAARAARARPRLAGRAGRRRPVRAGARCSGRPGAR
jgi:integrase